MIYNFSDTFKTNFKKAYTDLYLLHPKETEENFRFRYVRVDWFFPQHIHNVLNQITEVRNTYFKKVDIEACLFAGLFHDAGLVYKRDTSSPKDHENRSVEYAETVLQELGYDQNFIEKVTESIKATEPDYASTLPEAIVVRNADAYAHIISMHFFAKSNFSNDISSFIKWFDDKLDLTYQKISIPEIKNKVAVLVDEYKKMIVNYYSKKEESALFIEILLNM